MVTEKYMDSISGNRENFGLVFVLGLADKYVLRFANLIVEQKYMDIINKIVVIERPRPKFSSASIKEMIGGDNVIILSYVNVVGIGEDGATVFFKELPNIYTENKINICVKP